MQIIQYPFNIKRSKQRVHINISGAVEADSVILLIKHGVVRVFFLLFTFDSQVGGVKCTLKTKRVYTPGF